MTETRLFGTDGVRGVANQDLTGELAMALGMAAGVVLQRHSTAKNVIVGRDTRISGEMLEAALCSGFAAVGVSSVCVGVLPTPGVARLVLAERALAGAVISASHNPYCDNGIKLFGADGHKLADDVEDEIGALAQRLVDAPRAVAHAVGRIRHMPEKREQYVDAVLRVAETQDALKGLRIVLDCANGAASELAPDIFRALGAEVIVEHAEPDGININADCGSTHPKSMAAVVAAADAQAGVAFDGDADRAILADEVGSIVNGDHIMAIIAQDLAARGGLTNNVVVATIMSNVGLEEALAEFGAHLHRTNVGDRYVAEAMKTQEAAVGGEQSGHILLPHLTPTGDGIVTAIQTLSVMLRTGKKLSQLAATVKERPQMLTSIEVRSKEGLTTNERIASAIKAAACKVGNPAWVSVRASGTEPLIRIMVQGADDNAVRESFESLCSTVVEALGQPEA
ncbi:MAG: phosphoglucosamine mutase [Armatimonadetes bacterium]|nr:phosphoglucosamine mutase [Armatimonadota bacterium]MDE2205659.1 phosphoglucosamine mutase [Armatimonadota bacterium]